jgi:hypothetical protein
VSLSGVPAPVICAACRFENPAPAKFCGGCGTRLTAVCPGCRTENPPTFRFCSECGSPLGASAPAAQPNASPKDAVFRAQDAKVQSYTPAHLAEKILTSRSALEGERKAVTVLFADVSGFTELAGRLHPEDLHAVMDGCFERLSAAVHRFEGTINQVTGDGIMALFGAPIAHEDHAERAIHAALAIQSAVAGYAEALQNDKRAGFRMRIGLHRPWPGWVRKPARGRPIAPPSTRWGRRCPGSPTPACGRRCWHPSRWRGSARRPAPSA